MILVILLLSVVFSEAQSVLDDKLNWDQIETIAKAEKSGVGIRFEDHLSWEQVQEKAKAEKKAIFLDIYTTWCGPCKFMEQNVYLLKEVGDYMNRNFVSVKVQMDVTTKDNEFVKSWYETSKKMAKEYNVTAYPTLLFLNSEGIPSFKLDAICKPVNFIKSAKMSLDSNNGFLGKLNQYEAGKDDAGFVLDLIMHAQELGLSDQANRIGKKYAASRTVSQLLTKENLMILYKTTTSSKDVGFSVFINQKEKVQNIEPLLAIGYLNALTDKIIREENVVPYLKSLNGKPDWPKISKNLKKWGAEGNLLLLKEKYIYEGDIADQNPLYIQKIKVFLDRNASWKEILNGIHSLKAGMGEERLVGNTILSMMNRIMKGQQIDFNEFLNAVEYYEKNFSVMYSALALNNWAWFSFLKTDNKVYLKKASEWSREAVKLDPSAGNMDTYANLLHKLGKQHEAIQWEENALSKDPNNLEFIETLEKIKKGKPTWNRDL